MTASLIVIGLGLTSRLIATIAMESRCKYVQTMSFVCYRYLAYSPPQNQKENWW